MRLIDWTLSLDYALANVASALPDGSLKDQISRFLIYAFWTNLEESATSITSIHTVVLAGAVVTTNATRNL